MARRLILSVIGGSEPEPGSPEYELARELGRLAVDAGFRIACGGLTGIMEAVCRGAHESSAYREGDTIGILPGFEPLDANPWVDIPLGTGLDHYRNGLVANGDVVVAIAGKAGTLSELALAWVLHRPIIALAVKGWSQRLAGLALDDRRPVDDPAGATIWAAVTAEEAVELAVRLTRTVVRRPPGIISRANPGT